VKSVDGEKLIKEQKSIAGGTNSIINKRTRRKTPSHVLQ
jgi:hypothetical protein